MVNSGSDIYDGCIVEVVISSQPLGDTDSIQVRPHSLTIHSYKTPTFCDWCGEMLFGMFKQGLKCEVCSLNFHKRCVFNIPNDCRARRDLSLSGPEDSSGQDSCSLSAGRPAWVDLHLANRLKIPHTFVVHTYTKPTKCHLCNKMLVGVFKQGLQCKDCRYNVHKKCCELTPRDCTGDIRLELEVK